MPDIPDNLLLTDQIVTNIIDGLANSSPRVQHGYAEGPGLLPTGSRDILAFFCEVAVILDDYQKRKGISEKDRIKLSEEFPPMDMQTQLITYRVIHSVPGTVSQGRPGINNDGHARHEWVPQARYIQDDPEKPNSRTIIMGQFMDNVIEFTCWARANKAANTTAELFHDLLNIYRFYFKLKGFPEVLFQERLEDLTLDSSVLDSLKGRRLRYFVRTDKTFSIHEPMLRDIVLNLVLSNL